MSRTGLDPRTTPANLDTGDVVVILGKPEGSGSGYLYIEVNRPFATKRAFYLEREGYKTDRDYSAVPDQFKGIVEALLGQPTTIGISKLRIGADFFSPEISTHYVHLLDAYVRIALEKLAEAFDLPLDVYILTKRFKDGDVQDLLRAAPKARVVHDSAEVEALLYVKTHQ